jgi:hypothetical protein
VPILAISSDLTLADVTGAIGFGAHDVLALPASVTQIRTRLERAVFCGRPWVDTFNDFGPGRRRSLKKDWPLEKERRANAAAELASRAARDTEIAKRYCA